MAYVDDVFDDLVSESANIDAGSKDQEFDTSMNKTGIAMENPEQFVNDLIGNLRKDNKTDYSKPVAKDTDTLDSNPENIGSEELPDGSDDDMEEFSIGAMLPQGVGSTDGTGEDIDILYKWIKPEAISLEDFHEAVLSIFGQLDNSQIMEEEAARDTIHRANITYGPKINDEIEAANKALSKNNFEDAKSHATQAKKFVSEFKSEVEHSESDNFDMLLGFTKYICGNAYIENGKYAGGLNGTMNTIFLSVASLKSTAKKFRAAENMRKWQFSKKYRDKQTEKAKKHAAKVKANKMAKDAAMFGKFKRSAPGL